jgi:ribosome-binding factor A
MPSYRREKVTAQLKREISELISKNLVEKYGLITLIDIHVTSDFKEAKVYISIFEEKNKKEILAKLSEMAPEFQHVLGRRLRMKFTPRIQFVEDESIKKIDRIDELLNEVDNES